MISPIFCNDPKIKSLEIMFEWVKSVEYMKELFEKYKHTPVGEEVICHLIFQCWYAFTILPDTKSRYVVVQEIDFYKENWKSAIAKGLDLYYDKASVCWIIGYTSYTDNKFFPSLKRFGEDMMKRGISLSSEEMPFDVLSGKRRKNANDFYYIVPSALFPSECAADKFFRDRLEKSGITG